MRPMGWPLSCALLFLLAGCEGGGPLFAPPNQKADSAANTTSPDAETAVFVGPPSDRQVAEAASRSSEPSADAPGPTQQLLAPGAADGSELSRWDASASEAETSEDSAAPDPAFADAAVPPDRSDDGTAPGETARPSRPDRWAREREAAGRERSAGSELVELGVVFEVLRVDLPRKDGRAALKIWNHLNESIGDPGLTALLARNGLRIGVGDDETWPALRAVFEANDARTAHVDQLAESGRPVILPLGEVQSGNSYFLHRRTAGLEGGTFPTGQCQFQIDFAVSERDLASIELRIAPRLEESRTRTRVVDQGGALVTVRDRPAQAFEELTVNLTVAPGEYVVIGSSAEAKPAGEGFLLGSWWFTAKLGAETFETVLCVKPKVTRLDARASRP